MPFVTTNESVTSGSKLLKLVDDSGVARNVIHMIEQQSIDKSEDRGRELETAANFRSQLLARRVPIGVGGEQPFSIATVPSHLTHEIRNPRTKREFAVYESVIEVEK